MSDIAITAANVLASTGASTTKCTAGVSLTAGQVVYLDPADKKVKLADANAASPLYNVYGITLDAASAGQPITVVTSDPALVIGGTVTAGQIIVLSATPGALAPSADLASGYFLTILGVGIGSNKLLLRPLAAGVALP